MLSFQIAFSPGVPFREHRETAEESPVLETRTFLLCGGLWGASAALHHHGVSLRPDLHQVQKFVAYTFSTWIDVWGWIDLRVGACQRGTAFRLCILGNELFAFCLSS